MGAILHRYVWNESFLIANLQSLAGGHHCECMVMGISKCISCREHLGWQMHRHKKATTQFIGGVGKIS